MKKTFTEIFKTKKRIFLCIAFFIIPLVDLFTVWKNSPMAHNVENISRYNIYHPAKAAFLSGASEGHVGQMLIVWLLPLFLMGICGDKYIEEGKLKYHHFIICRMDRRKYYFDLVIKSFIIGALLVFITCMINFGLSCIVFHGGTSFRDLENYVEQFQMIDRIQFKHPYVTYFIYIGIFSLIAGIYGSVCTAISIIFPLYYIAYPLAFFIWLLPLLSPYSIGPAIQPFSAETDIKAFITGITILLIMFLIIIISMTIKLRTRRDEI